MGEGSIITQEMRDAIGVESEPRRNEVDKTWVRMFARSVGHTDPVFYDEEEAKRRGFRSLPAPPGYLGTPVYDPRTAADAGPGNRRFRSPFKRVLNGGTEIEYLGQICAGDVLTSRTKIADISETSGRLGPMLVTITETTYTNQNGEVVAKSRGTSLQY
jgi:hypothetical protein